MAAVSPEVQLKPLVTFLAFTFAIVVPVQSASSEVSVSVAPASSVSPVISFLLMVRLVSSASVMITVPSTASPSTLVTVTLPLFTSNSISVVFS